MANVPVLLKIMKETTRIAHTAGFIVRKILQTGTLDIIDKGTNDLQTKADRAAQTYIISEFQRHFPRLSVIGEEGDNVNESFIEFMPSTAAGTSDDSIIPADIFQKPIPEHLRNLNEEDVVVWIDPLDGTREFSQGITEGVTVLIGIAAAGKAIAGVIGQPFFTLNGNQDGRTIWGIVGVGYGGLSLKDSPKHKRVLCTTRSHSSPRVEAVLNALEADEILRVGGAGYKTLLLMEGQCNAYVYASSGCKKWDTCGPEAVLKATGGTMLNLQTGHNYEYDKDVQFVNDGGVLGLAPGEDRDWYLSKIASAST